ncbi:MAG: hypothetical protein M3T56_15180 [Chloroflexota bacterium]|nr:hypothetical protein [Chloroflexota bacterium]
MLQRSVKWFVLPIIALALVATSGDVRVDVAPRVQADALYMASPGSQSTTDDAPTRASLASRTLLRTDDSLATTAVTEPPAPTDSPAAAAPQPEPEPVVEVVPPPAVPVAPPPAVPATCPVNQFCYPRVGIAGTIVPYNDCSGRTDVGTAIRSITCVSPTYLAAHAYTQFGRIAGWRPGDVVFAYGKRYVVVDGFTQQGCVPPARAIAPLSLQTSLTPATCGPILVVQARPG